MIQKFPYKNIVYLSIKYPDQKEKLEFIDLLFTCKKIYKFLELLIIDDVNFKNLDLSKNKELVHLKLFYK